MSDKEASSNDNEAPSKLELLRARVHSSRESVVAKKKILDRRSSLEGNDDSSSLLSAETLPLHQKHEKRDLIEKIRQVEQHRESLQKDLKIVKKQLEERSQNMEDSQSALSTDQSVWEDRIQALETLNESLKEEMTRDEEAKAQLASLCDTLERNLQNHAQQGGSSSDEALASLSRDLRKAQSRESSLQLEISSLQSRKDQDGRNANNTEEMLQKQVEDYNKQMDQLTASMTAIQAADGLADDSDAEDSQTLAENIKDFEKLIATVKQREETIGSSSVVQELQDQIAAIADEQEDLCCFGEIVVQKLQVKIQTLQSVLSSQADFRKKLDAMILDLQKQLSTMRESSAAESERELRAHNESLSNLSTQLAEKNAQFSGLESQVSSLKQELSLAAENAKLLEEKEAVLKEASRQNDALFKQVQVLETNIQFLRDGAATASDDPAAEMELLMELQDVRQRMDQLTQEADHWKVLLEEEQSRSSMLSQEIEELKDTISKLENNRSLGSPAILIDAVDKDDIGLLNKMQTLQVKIEDLITQATTETEGIDEKPATVQSQSPSSQVLMELHDVRGKVVGLITTLEKEQAGPFSQVISSRAQVPVELKIRISNEMTGRFENLVVFAAPTVSLYEAVYNNSKAKSSNIRKWPTEIAQAAKEKRIEVQCVLLDRHGNSVKTFSDSEMKDYCTQSFSSLVADPLGLTRLVLRWRNAEESDPAQLKSVLISNEATGRRKEVIVPISEDMKLFDCIYNHDAVRAANIRKWPNAICEGVSNNTHAIRFVLLNEGVVNKEWSVDDLKEISSKQLIDLVPTPEDTIQLVLKCQQVSDEIAVPAKATGRRSRLSLKHADFAGDGFPNISDTMTYIRAQVTNETTGRFQGLVLPVSEDVNLYEAMYCSDALRDGLVRRWPKKIVDKVKEKALEIKCWLVDQNGNILRSFDIDELKDVSTEGLVGLATATQDLYKFVLCCQTVADFEGSHAASEKSISNANERQTRAIAEESSISAMRMQVYNETTERSIDIEVLILPDLNVFDGVYSNESVRKAKIRKWPTEVAQAVKSRTSEIKVAFTDGDDDIRVFFVDDLKLISTQQLADLIPSSNRVVRMVLRWQKTAAEEIRELKACVDDLETQKLELEGTLETMKAEHSAKLAEAEKLAAEHRASVNSVTTELANVVASQSIADMDFAEKEMSLMAALEERTKSLDDANMKLVRLEGEVRRSQLHNSAQASLDVKFQMKGLEREKGKLMKTIEENPLQEELRALQLKLDNAVDREASLKDDLDAYKIRRHQELHGATASESSAKGELRTLKNRLQEQLEAAKSRESQLMTEVVSYKDKLQQDRYMLSCLSTELYDSNYRESELREALDRLETMPKNDTLHTEETAVQIVDAEYAGEAPPESLQVELDSARSMNEALSIHVQELQKQVEKLETAHASKEREYRQLMEQDEEMKASIKSLTSILEQTTDSNKTLSTRVEELEAEATSLKKEQENIFDRAAVAEKEVEEKSRLLAETTKLKSKLEFANEDNQRFSNMLEQKERFIANMQGASETFDSQERNRDVLAMLEKSHQREKKLQVQYRVCLAELEKLTESSKAYQEATDTKLASTQEVMDEQLYANKLLKGVIAKLNQMNESLEEECAKKSKDLYHLQSQNKELAHTKLGDLQSINKHLTEEVTFLREQKSKFTKTVAKLQSQLQQMAKQKTDGDMKMKQMEAIAGEMKEVKKQSVTKDYQLDFAQQRVGSLARKLKQESQERERDAERVSDQARKHNEEVQLLKQQIIGLQQKLGDPLRVEKTDVLIDKVREGEFKNKKLKKECNALRTELEDVKNRMAQFKQEIGNIGF